MTALTLPPGRLLTSVEYAALGEDDSHRYELQEGSLVMSPSPAPRHMVAMAQLFGQLRDQLPAELMVIPDVDLDLDLAAAGQPGTVRRPDLVVVNRTEFDRVDRNGGLLLAVHAVLVVEIVSPGSWRADTMIKRGEYADAKIPSYWIVDLESPVTLVACHLAGEFGYQDRDAVRGVFETSEPFALRIDLDALS